MAPLTCFRLKIPWNQFFSFFIIVIFIHMVDFTKYFSTESSGKQSIEKKRHYSQDAWASLQLIPRNICKKCVIYLVLTVENLKKELVCHSFWIFCSIFWGKIQQKRVDQYLDLRIFLNFLFYFSGQNSMCDEYFLIIVLFIGAKFSWLDIQVYRFFLLISLFYFLRQNSVRLS